MTDKERSGWRFKGKTPLWFSLVAGLFFLDAVLHFALLGTISSWAQGVPDVLHTHGLPFRDGNMYFTSAWLGAYLDARWTTPALFVLLLILLFVYRDQLEH